MYWQVIINSKLPSPATTSYRSYYPADQGKELNTSLTLDLTSVTGNITNKLLGNKTEGKKIQTHPYLWIAFPANTTSSDSYHISIAKTFL